MHVHSYCYTVPQRHKICILTYAHVHIYQVVAQKIVHKGYSV